MIGSWRAGGQRSWPTPANSQSPSAAHPGASGSARCPAPRSDDLAEKQHVLQLERRWVRQLLPIATRFGDDEYAEPLPSTRVFRAAELNLKAAHRQGAGSDDVIRRACQRPHPHCSSATLRRVPSKQAPRCGARPAFRGVSIGSPDVAKRKGERHEVFRQVCRGVPTEPDVQRRWSSRGSREERNRSGGAWGVGMEPAEMGVPAARSIR